ncbi:MAG: hypothetical protein JNN15_18265, partial [Blastocatellia bacterium]|nr:hypothetical protein [Blastocatellia bacterium]
EPYSVVNFDRLASNSPKKFSGRYISIENGTPTEVWMAARMDKMIALSMNSYNQQYPIAFTNWPTLDPLVHPTEATKEEEIALYKKLGRRIAGELKEYDNDAVGLDMGKTKATVNFPAGIFASYHAYPYYPDFMNLDPTYRKTIGSNGINAYLGYLLDLKRHHKGEPVLIAETGVPSNRETAHLQPQGWNHGGHNEKQQAEINVQLVETIREAGLSGVLMFAWIDEWFKHNWIVLPFEIPAERTRLWHNVQDAEQNYGLVAMKAGSGNFLIDGDVKEWKDIPALLSETTTQSEPTIQSDVAVKSLKVTSDESYLRLCLEFNNLDSDKDGSTDWDKFSLLIGIDTYDLKDQNGQPIGLGDHSLPNISNLKISSGNEFLIELISPQKSRLLVDNNYDIFTHRYNRPYSSKFNEDGIFIEQIAETNRERIGRDATIYPAQRVNRSPFRYGKETEGDSLSEWAVDIKNSSIEMRIPWGLLYVTDPSSRLVLHDDLTKSKEIGTHQTEGFRFSVVATNRSRVISTLPKAIGQTIPLSPVYQWKTWEKPTYHSYLKPAYYALQNCFLKIAKQEDYLK